MKNKITISILLYLFSMQLAAQNTTGKVTSASGTPLSGASVYLDGTTIGTSTNQEGEINKFFNQIQYILDYSVYGI